MDLRLHANPQLHYGVNGGAGHSSRPGEDDVLQFLSQEEKECLQFFEQTIDSLEESLEENDQRPGQARSGGPLQEVDGTRTSSPTPAFLLSSYQASPPNPKDQDIIDLVRPEPDFSPTSPDLQTTAQRPESHFEIKPRCDPTDSLPSEYNPPLPSGSYGPTDGHASYHPPGCIPTPVLIAQKIAENQTGGTSNVQPASLTRRCSLESEKPSSPSSDHPVKQGPPTSAKPARFPANISVILGSKDHQSHSLSTVNIQERRAQMLANLTGSHPLLQADPQQAAEEGARNIPRRSISFKDPTPDKSRMEALSKLGLTRNRAMSGGMSLLVSPNSSSLDRLTDAGTSSETSAKPLEADDSATAGTGTKLPEANSPTPHYNVERKPDIPRTRSLRGQSDTITPPSSAPPASTQSSDRPPPPEDKESAPPQPGVTSLEFNSYGGKSIVVNPTVSPRSDPPTSPTTTEPKVLPPAPADPSEVHAYGGKTKVVTPAPAVVNKGHLPDILSSHMDKSQTLPAKSEPLLRELNSYGGKSQTVKPSASLNPPSSGPARTLKGPAPTPAPRPPRHSYHGPVTTQKAAQRTLSPEHKRRPGSMFRPQGITVQFGGRGASDESRRDALRKLGLLKDS